MIDTTTTTHQQTLIGSNNAVSLHTPLAREVQFSNSMHEILPGVYLGPYSCALLHSLANLRERGIKYIICIRQSSEAHFIKPQTNEPIFVYLTLDIADKETQNLVTYFPRVRDFIDQALSRNSKVLIHSNTGNSRAATLVAGYIMEKFQMTASQALLFVKSKRRSIDPNEGFKAQLREYEPIYQALQSVNNGGSSSNSLFNNKFKRRLDIGENSIRGENYQLLNPPPPSPDSNEDSAIIELSNTYNNEISSQLNRFWSKR